jgi:chromosomal replication initiation ATPase DnaA
VACLVAAHFDVPAEAIRGPLQGSRRLAHARRIAIYLAHVAAGLSVTGAGAAFARSRASAIEACRQVEARRDDDRTLDRLLDDIAEDISAVLPR